MTDNFSMVNVKRSIESYIEATVGNLLNYSVEYDLVPFDDRSQTYWVRPRIVVGNKEYVRGISSTRFAYNNDIELYLDIIVRKSGVTTSELEIETRDNCAAYFKVGDDINLVDHDGSSSILCKMRVRELFLDEPGDETNEFFHWHLGYRINFLEEVDKP